MVEVAELSEFGGTLNELHQIVVDLIMKHGSDAHITFTAGESDVTALLMIPEQKNGMR